MQLSSKQLRTVIREELLRSTPVTRRGQRMSEVRANLIADQMLEEGLFDSIKRGFAALKGAASGGASALGDEAGKALAPAAKAIQAVAASAKAAASGVADSLGKIKDEALKAAAAAAKTAMQNSLRTAVQTAIKDGLKNLTAAGMKEEEAKTFISTMAAAEIAALVGG